MKHQVLPGAAVAILMLGGCAVPNQEMAFETVQKQTDRSLVWIKTPRDAQIVAEKVDLLLATPLNGENAVRIALINNRELQRVYEEIGVAHADLVQAGMMSNPVLGYSFGHGGGVNTKTVSLEVALLDLLWIPLKRELGGIALEEAKLRVGDEVLKTVRETSVAFARARASEEISRLHDTLVTSYETSLQLAYRQYTAGNLSKRELLKIEEGYARTRLNALDARRMAAEERETLNTLLGVYGDSTRYRFAQGSDILEPPPSTSEGLERIAIANRLDIAAAKKRFEYAAREAGIVDATRLLEEISLEYESEKSSGEARFNTLGAKIPLPLFDMGQARSALAAARYNESAHALYALSVSVRSDVRRSSAVVRYRYDAAREYRENIIRIHEEILAQTGLYYNGMLEGIYELLEDQRRLTEAKIASIEALFEYEKAVADLAYAAAIPLGEKRDETR